MRNKDIPELSTLSRLLGGHRGDIIRILDHMEAAILAIYQLEMLYKVSDSRLSRLDSAMWLSP